MAFLRPTWKTGSMAALLAALQNQRRASFLSVCLLLFVAASSQESFAADSARASKLKAAFVFNFAQFTEWPTDAFADKDAPLVLGILGNTGFADILEETVRNEIVRGRRLVVERYNRVA